MIYLFLNYLGCPSHQVRTMWTVRIRKPGERYRLKSRTNQRMEERNDEEDVKFWIKIGKLSIFLLILLGT